MKAKPSHIFVSAAETKRRKLDTLREKQAVAAVFSDIASGVLPFERVDIDPEVVEALDIVGHPGRPDPALKVIPVSMLGGDITVTCDTMPNANTDDIANVYLFVTGSDPEEGSGFVAVGDDAFFNDLNPGDPYELTFDVSQLNITDGQDMEYDLYVGQGGQSSNIYFSNNYRLRFDRRKPGLVPEFSHVKLPDEYLENGVTKAQIEASNGFMAQILAYFEHEEDDETWLVFTVVGSGATYEFATGRIPEPAHFLDVLVPLTFFEAPNNIDGRVAIALKARDVAGNENTGPAHEVNMLIGSSPSGLQQIEVPLHDNDPLPNLINLADSRTPPEFVVPDYATPQLGDEIRVSIDGDVYEVTVPVVPGSPGDPVAVGPIPRQVIEDIGRGTNGQFTFEIDYSLIRNGFDIPSGQPKTIRCDLRASGWGTELVEGIVKGPTGPIDNEITPEDSTLPLTATIPHLAKNGDEAFENNDRITLYKVNMDGSIISTIGSPTPANAGIDLAYNIPALALTNGTNYVRYDNFRSHTGGASNTEVSPIWQVNVTSSSGLPGGGTPIRFDHWIFRDCRMMILDPGVAFQPTINRRRSFGLPQDGTRFTDVIVRVHHYANMAQGDKIVVTVDGYDNRTATGTPAFSETLTEYTVTDVDAAGKDPAIPEDTIPQPELPLFRPHGQEPPPANEERRFADIKIPYDTMILRLNAEGKPGLGSIRVKFAITNAAGTGVSDPANTVFLDVDARPPT